MGIKHSKYKNTGILFELLIRQITTDILNENNSNAISLLKKYFNKTELIKEYKLYEIISKTHNLTEAKANLIINSIMESASKLDKKLIKQQKYNLIKEIKEYYKDDFFKTKLPNYKIYASLCNLLEEKENKIQDVIQNKTTLLEHLISNKKTNETNLLHEIKDDKSLRIITYKLLLEKFNKKYKSLKPKQKLLLKEYINVVDNGERLKNLYNLEVNNIKKELNTISISDNIIKVKLDEVKNLLVEVKEVKDKDLNNLLLYYDLIDEFNGLE